MKQGYKDFDEIRSLFSKIGTKGYEGVEIGPWDREAFEKAYKTSRFISCLIIYAERAFTQPMSRRAERSLFGRPLPI